MKFIGQTTLSNQNISNFLLIYSHTFSDEEGVFFRVFADQIVGAGFYQIYASIQIGGVGSEFPVMPVTTVTVPTGTSAAFITQVIPVDAGDVVKLYLKGQAGDTATPDIRTELWQDDSFVTGDPRLPATVIAAKADLPPSGTMVSVHLLTTPVVPASLPILSNRLSCRRGDDFSWPITGLGSLVGYSKLYFTVKRSIDDPDSEAIAQVFLTPTNTGLLILNGGPATLTDGSIVIDDIALGNITINILANATKEFDVDSFDFDVEMVKGTVVSTLAPDGVFVVLGDSTRSIT